MAKKSVPIDFPPQQPARVTLNVDPPRVVKDERKEGASVEGKEAVLVERYFYAGAGAGADADLHLENPPNADLPDDDEDDADLPDDDVDNADLPEDDEDDADLC